MVSALIGQLGALVVASLVGAIVLRVAAKWVEGLAVPFWQAYVTVFLAGIGVVVIDVVLAVVVGVVAGPVLGPALLVILLLPAGFLIQSWTINLRLGIRFGRAALVTLVMLGIQVILVLILVVPLVVIASLAS